jgi:hypothetical protein
LAKGIAGLLQRLRFVEAATGQTLHRSKKAARSDAWQRF